MNLNKLKKLSGDASIRSFYRKKNYKNSSIIVYCKKQKKSNLLIYEAINNLLIKNNLPAPKMINNSYDENHIEIEDFGDLTVFQLLRKKKENQLFYYNKILLLLKKIQKVKTKKIKTFINTQYKIPNYSKEKLVNEANLFLQWYLPKFIKDKKRNIPTPVSAPKFKNTLCAWPNGASKGCKEYDRYAASKFPAPTPIIGLLRNISHPADQWATRSAIEKLSIARSRTTSATGCSPIRAHSTSAGKIRRNTPVKPKTAMDKTVPPDIPRVTRDHIPVR